MHIERLHMLHTLRRGVAWPGAGEFRCPSSSDATRTDLGLRNANHNAKKKVVADSTARGQAVLTRGCKSRGALASSHRGCSAGPMVAAAARDTGAGHPEAACYPQKMHKTILRRQSNDGSIRYSKHIWGKGTA